MYRRYYDGFPRNSGFQNSGEIIVPESTNEITYEPDKNNSEGKNDEISITSFSNSFPFKNFELDDIILIGVLIFLLADSDDKDPITLIIIGYLLLCELL